MYTQCPRCETIFRLSAEVLSAASGRVRCGRCGHAFLALTRLAERPDAFTAAESHFELEARADRILGSMPTEAMRTDRPVDDYHDNDNVNNDNDNDYDNDDDDDIDLDALPGVQIEHLEVLGGIPTADDAALEFTLPPRELDRIFVEARQPAWPMSELREPAAPEEEPPPEALDTAPAAALAAAPAEEPLEARPVNKRRAGLLIGAAALLALVLAAQVVDHNRVYIATNTPFGGLLRSLYAKAGFALPVPGNVSLYQLRQWGVTGDPGASGNLRVRASILNTAARFQPYPLLRVTLTDRFGKLVGAREFKPAEYLGKPPSALMAPGMRSDATISIVDPGKNAEGFEIDVCLRAADRRIVCAGDAAAQAK